MARRALPWGRSLQRSLAKLTRSALRAGSRAMAKVARPALKMAKARKTTTAAKPARPATAAANAPSPADGWKLGVAGFGAGSRRYRLFRPPGLKRGELLPLLVMLHGCGQSAEDLATATRMNRIAARERFLVLYPEQDRLANHQGCWNWFDTRNGRAQTESALILAAIDQVVAEQAADPSRVAVAGLSAGAAMAALLAMRHPERFAAVAMHSGVAPGAAQSTASAMSAMQGRRKPAIVAGAAGLPALLVIHGTADGIVNIGNGREAAKAWALAMGAEPAAVRTVRRGKRHPMQVTDFKSKRRTLVSLCEIGGLAHAWSGGAPGRPYSDPHGPDASRLIWAFAQRQFRRADLAQPFIERTSSR